MATPSPPLSPYSLGLDTTRQPVLSSRSRASVHTTKIHLCRDASYGNPNTNGRIISNFVDFEKNNHPVLSVFFCNPQHPFGRRKRLLALLSTLGFAYFFNSLLGLINVPTLCADCADGSTVYPNGSYYCDYPPGTRRLVASTTSTWWSLTSSTSTTSTSTTSSSTTPNSVLATLPPSSSTSFSSSSSSSSGECYLTCDDASADDSNSTMISFLSLVIGFCFCGPFGKVVKWAGTCKGCQSKKSDGMRRSCAEAMGVVILVACFLIGVSMFVLGLFLGQTECSTIGDTFKGWTISNLSDWFLSSPLMDFFAFRCYPNTYKKDKKQFISEHGTEMLNIDGFSRADRAAGLKPSSNMTLMTPPLSPVPIVAKVDVGIDMDVICVLPTSVSKVESACEVVSTTQVEIDVQSEVPADIPVADMPAELPVAQV